MKHSHAAFCEEHNCTHAASFHCLGGKDRCVCCFDKWWLGDNLLKKIKRKYFNKCK